MIIEIKVFSTLRQYLSSSESRLDGDRWEIPEGETVGGVLDRLGLPEDQDKILMVNGLHARNDRVLKAGDVLWAFPSLTGG